jgi:hypothetical protein
MYTSAIEKAGASTECEMMGPVKRCDVWKVRVVLTYQVELQAVSDVLTAST